ncbi:MAG: sulfite exporter TauE/SafE family protein [Varibaculum cambriense]|uniref:sulfite exporter TauE/SafE family protein n=1 Tax=Varibaculum cambriense TaxID=184870 RepID=UPI00241C6A75|nr:sulfite exporter TauE/SafE family protein [Varibaculum cambriense]MBS5972969.1 sulfite exporter TauE/SafE family protein [Varibaculum cambriense]
MSLLLPIVVGICVGIIVGLLGAGGGILSVPILVYLLGQSPHNAAAGSLLIVGATSLIALIGRRKEVHWKQGAVFGALSITGSFIGSFLNSLVSPNLLMYLFSALLLIVAGLMFRKAAKEKNEAGAKPRTMSPNTDANEKMCNKNTRGKENSQRPNSRLHHWITIIFAAVLIGVLTGFFGVGGGFAVVPALTLIMHFDMKEASATSLLVMVIASLAGLAARMGTAIQIDYLSVLPFAFASMIGGPIGASLTRKTKSTTLTFLFALLLLLVAVYTLSATLLGA